MALSPWPEVGSDRDDAVALLAAAVGSSESVAERLGPVAAALVERYASRAPPEIKSESVVRCCGWLYQSTPGLADSKLSAGPVDIVRTFSPGYSALRHSGSMALLSPWKIRRAGRIG